MWSQRVRVTWVKEGDLNTTFFHKTASMRNRNNAILRLESQGEVIHDHFKGVFCYNNPQRWPGNIPGHQSQRRGWMERMTNISEAFSEVEIKAAVWSLGANKSSGPDGFPIFSIGNSGTR